MTNISSFDSFASSASVTPIKAIKFAGYLATAASAVLPGVYSADYIEAVHSSLSSNYQIYQYDNTAPGVIDGIFSDDVEEIALEFFTSLSGSQEQMDTEIASALQIDLWDLYEKV